MSPVPIKKKFQWAGIKNPHETRKEPLWKGPEEDGITFSLLSRFLVCRERFRLLVVEGLSTQDQFNKSIEFGQMWHTCEEALAANYPWEKALLVYCQNLCHRYPTDQEQVDKWYNVCKRQFPLYLEYWESHPDTLQRESFMQEVSFSVPYRLPSGRVVRLRGKWDSVDLIGSRKARGIYLQENKTKGDVNELQITRQLTFDLQTMLYLVALHEAKGIGSSDQTPAWTRNYQYPILGVRYNVVRRPLSGGKGTIVQGKGTQGTKCSKCKGEGSHPHAQFRAVKCVKCDGIGRVGGTPPETKAEYYDRLADYIEKEPETYFFRWRVEIGEHDVKRFKDECLDPILEQLCDWWEFIRLCEGNPWDFRKGHDKITAQHRHWRHPFGVYNVLDEGGSSDVDEYLASGSEAGLARITTLFPELT